MISRYRPIKIIKCCMNFALVDCIFEQAPLRPNKFRCIIALTTLSTYYIMGGGKQRPSVECQHVTIYVMNEKSVFGDKNRIPEKIWAPWALLKQDKAIAYLGLKGFHMAFES